MSSAEILDRLQVVFRTQFNDDSLEIEDSTSSADIIDWDSLAHLRLILSIEKEFDCRFDSADLEALQEVGDIVQTIIRKRAV